MAKSSYKIPYSINKSKLDIEINLSPDSKKGRTISVRTILLYLSSGLLLLWVVLNTFFKSLSIPVRVIFSLLWIAMTVLLLSKDATGQSRASYLPVMIQYVQKKKRKIMTRTSSNSYDFYRLIGIDELNPENGLIRFSDGTWGFAYEVVGVGSNLLFDSDREAILNRVEAFYRRMRHDYEIIFVTTKEPQKIRNQIESMNQREKNCLNFGLDPDLVSMIQDQKHFMEYELGTYYRTIHQYMILKANSEEELVKAHNNLEMEVRSSSLMFKQCEMLVDDDLYTPFRLTYRGRESV